MKNSFNQVFFFYQINDRQLNSKKVLMTISGKLIYQSQANDVYWILSKNKKELGILSAKKPVMHS